MVSFVGHTKNTAHTLTGSANNLVAVSLGLYKTVTVETAHRLWQLHMNMAHGHGHGHGNAYVIMVLTRDHTSAQLSRVCGVTLTDSPPALTRLFDLSPAVLQYTLSALRRSSYLSSSSFSPSPSSPSLAALVGEPSVMAM